MPSFSQVVRTFAKHFQTQEVMPEDMIARLCASKHLFCASEIQMQVFYSKLDQVYHGSHPLRGSTTEVLANLQKHYYRIHYVPDTVSILAADIVPRWRHFPLSSFFCQDFLYYINASRLHFRFQRSIKFSTSLFSFKSFIFLNFQLFLPVISVLLTKGFE